MFGQLKDKRKVFIVVVCAFILIAGGNYLYKYIISKEGLTDDALTDDALIVDANSENENVIEVDPAYKKQSRSSTILPVQSQSSVGPASVGEPVIHDTIMQDPVISDINESFTGVVTKYSF